MNLVSSVVITGFCYNDVRICWNDIAVAQSQGSYPGDRRRLHETGMLFPT